MSLENEMNSFVSPVEHGDVSLEGFDQEAVETAVEANNVADQLETASPTQMEVIKQMAKDPKTYLYALGGLATAFLADQAFLNIKDYIPSPEQFPEQVNNFRLFSAWAAGSAGILNAHQYFQSRKKVAQEQN